MYAVFSHGGKQYKVKIGQTLRIEKINSKIGKNIKFKNILFIKKDTDFFLGTPVLKNATIQACVFNHGKEKKINIIKFNRRKHYKKKQGHRQHYTSIKITKINLNKDL
ncbi:50S ribosomal protein L21 [Buchnera aphidicola]|uniref:50S ribosomal protein L21 n=1 Tax=Buchnera aphidicola TaxID=9 RepID=UPI003464D174